MEYKKIKGTPFATGKNAHDKWVILFGNYIVYQEEFDTAEEAEDLVLELGLYDKFIHILLNTLEAFREFNSMDKEK